MSGILLINKTSGHSSFDLVRVLRNRFDEKKIGYLGTLDPLASGLMVFFLGKATKLIPYFSESDKIYSVLAEMGKSSDTYDITGKISEYPNPQYPEQSLFENMLTPFLGYCWQIQPPFSALKFHGKRAYKYARDGEKINLGKRQVVFHNIDLIQYSAPYFSLQVHCSYGTYIRSLIHEIGESLKIGAVMTNLKRVQVGIFSLREAKRIDEISEDDLISLVSIFDYYGDSLGITPREQKYLLNKFLL